MSTYNYRLWKTNPYKLLKTVKDQQNELVKLNRYRNPGGRSIAEEQKLQEYLKEEHARRYRVRTTRYKKGSENIGWRIQPRTDLKGRKKYRWGSLRDLYPPNLSNPLTCNVPSLIDFLETRQPKYFFYTLENNLYFYAEFPKYYI